MHVESLLRLRLLRACDAATHWAESQPSAETAWRQCPRGDWLLWIAARIGIDRKLLARAACACARTALPHVAAGEERPRIAIEMAEAWARGEATLEDVHRRARGALAAWQTADAAYAAAAAVFAADAADAADADAAVFAAYAAVFAAYAAADAAAARSASLARYADIVREIIPWEAMAAKLEDK